MKKITFFAKMFAITLVCAILAACSGNTTKTQSTGEVNVSTSSDIAYISLDSLLDKYDFYNDLRTQLMAKQSKMEQDLQTKGKSLERKMMELQSNYEKRLITPTRAQELQQNYAVEQQKLLQQRDQQAMELADDQQRITTMIMDSIQSYIKEYNSDNRFKLILNNNLGAVLYVDNTMDITAPILEGLNNRYNSNNAKNAQPIDTTKK